MIFFLTPTWKYSFPCFLIGKATFIINHSSQDQTWTLLLYYNVSFTIALYTDNCTLREVCLVQVHVQFHFTQEDCFNSPGKYREQVLVRRNCFHTQAKKPNPTHKPKGGPNDLDSLKNHQKKKNKSKLKILFLHLPAKHLEQRFIVLLDLGQKKRKERKKS